MTQGVYSITHIPTGRTYVGASVRIEHRYKDHLTQLEQNRHVNGSLQTAFTETGAGAFLLSILEEVDDLTELAGREIFWANHLSALAEEGGFNIAPPGHKAWRPTEATGCAWKLQPLLDSRHITRYALQKKSDVPMNTIRAMYDGQTTRVDFSVLDRIITTLREMTGEDLTLTDMLEWRK